MKKIYSALFVITLVFPSILYASNYQAEEIRQFSEFALLETTSSLLNTSESNTPTSEEAKLDAIKKMVIDGKKMVDRLDSAVFLTLPIGLSYSNDAGQSNPDYCIIIDEASINPTYAEFSAFMSIKNPIDGTVIRFRAKISASRLKVV